MPCFGRGSFGLVFWFRGEIKQKKFRFSVQKARNLPKKQVSTNLYLSSHSVRACFGCLNP